MRTSLPRLAGTLLAMALLSACGQKGALYLPEAQQNVVVTTTAPAPDAAPAPAADTPAAATPAADPTDPESQRRSNTPPRTN